MKIRIVYNSSMPFYLGGMDGITLYPFIFVGFPENDPRTAKLLKHELVHIEQIYRDGFFKFYLTYIWYSIRYGYKNNPYEVEAYRRQEES